MDRLQRRGELRPALSLHQVGIEPLGQGREAVESALDRLMQHSRIEPLGQRIDGLHGRKRGEVGLGQDAVRMDHLQVAVPGFEQARHPTRAAEREGLLDPSGIVKEEHESDVAGVVLDQYLVRRLDAGRRVVRHHTDL